MFLEKINTPQDLRKFSLEELSLVSDEIRKRIIEIVSINGGHIASSLGAVELIVALHYCFNTPEDKIIFDVGHQAYAHKIITGRNSLFPSLRQYSGISGFPSHAESEYDVFTTGHSSNAVSLVLGLASARDLSNKNYRTIAVIGDGSLSGGLCFEGLNNAGHLKKDILVVLNTNELSISANAGALSTYLNKIISLPAYNRFRGALESFVKSRMPKGSRLIKLANKFEEGLKGLFVPGMFFEELGFRYFGPFDGHNLAVLIKTFKNISSIKGPLLMHVVTKKGKGYKHSESSPVKFHGIGKFDVETGECIKKDCSLKSYTEAFSEKIVELAAANKNIIAITAAMPEGTGLDKFRDAYAQRFFDVGIAESHAVSFAAGLAKEGMQPVVAIYSTFLQRAYDQIIEDVALQNLGIVFAVDRAGIVGEDGVTHQGIFDISFLRNVPNLISMAPKDTKELEAMLEFAVGINKPVSIRYPRSACLLKNITQDKIVLGKSEILKEGKDYLIIALGSMVEAVLDAEEMLRSKGLSGTIVNARFINPLDTELLRKLSAGRKNIFTAEEGILEGGFGSAVSEAIDRQVTRIGLPDNFIPHGKREVLLDKYGLSAKKIAERINSFYV